MPGRCGSHRILSALLVASGAGDNNIFKAPETYISYITLSPPTSRIELLDEQASNKPR